MPRSELALALPPLSPSLSPLSTPNPHPIRPLTPFFPSSPPPTSQTGSDIKTFQPSQDIPKNTPHKEGKEGGNPPSLKGSWYKARTPSGPTNHARLKRKERPEIKIDYVSTAEKLLKENKARFDENMKVWNDFHDRLRSLSTKHGSVWDKLVGRKVSKPNAQADAKLLVQDIKKTLKAMDRKRLVNNVDDPASLTSSKDIPLPNASGASCTHSSRSTLPSRKETESNPPAFTQSSDGAQRSSFETRGHVAHGLSEDASLSAWRTRVGKSYAPTIIEYPSSPSYDAMNTDPIEEQNAQNDDDTGIRNEPTIRIIISEAPSTESPVGEDRGSSRPKKRRMSRSPVGSDRPRRREKIRNDERERSLEREKLKDGQASDRAKSRDCLCSSCQLEGMGTLNSDDTQLSKLRHLTTTNGSPDLYRQYRSSVIEIITSVPTKNLVNKLWRTPAAQPVSDFLSQVLSDQDSRLSPRQRKMVLHLLSQLAKSPARVFPRSLLIEGVECKLSTRPLAEGGCGYIYQGRYEGKVICVKSTKSQLSTRDSILKAQASELIIWSHLDHQNILPFLGIYRPTEKVPGVCIVSPWMENGDLLQYLGNFPNVSRIPLLHDITSGVHHLHELDVVHADLKAKNVLVSRAGRVMLADFGISRVSVTLETTVMAAGGTCHWMAPEMLLNLGSQRPEKESDIWALGCTFYEVITSEVPFHEFGSYTQLIAAFERGHPIPTKPKSTSGGRGNELNMVWPVAQRCWEYDPKQRPKSKKILFLVSGMNVSDNRPSDLEARKGKKVGSDIDYGHAYETLSQSPVRYVPSVSTVRIAVIHACDRRKGVLDDIFSEEGRTTPSHCKEGSEHRLNAGEGRRVAVALREGRSASAAVAADGLDQPARKQFHKVDVLSLPPAPPFRTSSS